MLPMHPNDRYADVSRRRAERELEAGRARLVRRAAQEPGRWVRLRAAATKFATALRTPLPVGSPTLLSFQGVACTDAGIEGALELVTLPDGRRVLAHVPTARAV